jgi:hypothetical protein
MRNRKKSPKRNENYLKNPSKGMLMPVILATWEEAQAKCS